TQRGNNGQDVFFVDDDRRVYLELLREQARRFEFRVEGYCLMTNHVHVVGVPEREESLAKTIGRTHFLYTQYVNRWHGRGGHLWQNRFFSCPMDQDYAWHCLAYVELNPVRAGLVRKAWEWDWSSAGAHCGETDGDAILDVAAWRARVPAKEWKARLKAVAGDKVVPKEIRAGTHTGRPLGSDSFLSKLEHRLGRRVRALPIGRQNGWRKSAEEVEINGDCLYLSIYRITRR
ncbi:MAG: transposase, partial [Candidatus Hydrogenedentes bacterium]|nr:transposase [Candidatus Hydrogenedentota bacterium]